jgi:hypothetical protein
MILPACKHRKIRRIIHSSNISADTSMQDLDSSLISLKSFTAVPINEAICQLWKMDDVDQKHWNEFLWDSLSDKRKYPELALYKDFNVTENARCDMRFGKWKIDKKRRELLLNFTDGTHKTYFVEKILLQKIIATEKTGDDEARINFLSDGITHKQLADDPFYFSNNLWRIKPKYPETDEQIIGRLKQCVHFYSLFFLDNHQRDAKEISFTGLPNCFVWYNGGIGLPLELDLDKKWIDCFYSEKQALRGYGILKTLIEKHELKWPKHPTSWIKQTHEVLDQIHDKL